MLWMLIQEHFIISSYYSSSICTTISDRCKVIKQAKNLTQQQFAGGVGALLSHAYKFELQGRGNLEMFVKIPQALQVVQQLAPLLNQQEVLIAELEKQQAAQQREWVWL